MGGSAGRKKKVPMRGSPGMRSTIGRMARMPWPGSHQMRWPATKIGTTTMWTKKAGQEKTIEQRWTQVGEATKSQDAKTGVKCQVTVKQERYVL